MDAEITDWPSATQQPRGRVIEILGDENDFRSRRRDHDSQVSPATSISARGDRRGAEHRKRHSCRRISSPPRLSRAPDSHHRRRNRARFRRCGPRSATGKRQLRTASTHRRRGPIRNAQFAARSGSASARHQRVFSGSRRSDAAAGTVNGHLQPAPPSRPTGAFLHDGDRPSGRNRRLRNQ